MVSKWKFFLEKYFPLRRTKLIKLLLVLRLSRRPVLYSKLQEISLLYDPKTEICINSGLNFGEKRNRPNTNKIWSIPLGKICWKPIIKYLVISLNKFEYFFSIEMI